MNTSKAEVENIGESAAETKSLEHSSSFEAKPELDFQSFTLQGIKHIPPGEKENHLQNAIFGGYVSSLEGNQ